MPARPAKPEAAATPRPRQDPEAFLRRLEWTVIRRLDGVLFGDYRTLFRGFGLDLADLREYQYGDDVRHIDWNVTARLQTPYVREYHEDRDVTAWFLLDLSPSLDTGAHAAKRTVSAEFTAVLARLLARHGNRVGALLYGEKMDAVLPPRTGRAQVLELLARIRARPERTQSAPTDLGAFLTDAGKMLRRRSLVFVVSDFVSTPGWAGALAQLSRRHEVVAVRLFDPLETELPDLGMFLVQDAETGEQLFVDASDRGFRKRFAQAAAAHEETLRAGFRAAGVDVLELATDDELFDALMRFTRLRKLRSRLAAGAVRTVGAAAGVAPA